MKVPVLDIAPQKGMNLSFSGKEPWIQEILGRLTADDPDVAGLEKADELRADVRLTREGKTVFIEGSAHAEIHPPCARCLKPVTTTLDPAFNLTLFPDRAKTEAGEEVELSEEELDEFTYKGDEVDVGQILNEQVLLERPFRILCSEDCKGLCPTCGADKNEKTCDCPEQPASLAFAALKDIKLESPKN